MGYSQQDEVHAEHLVAEWHHCSIDVAIGLLVKTVSESGLDFQATCQRLNVPDTRAAALLLTGPGEVGRLSTF